jgi:hypothetical protein
MMIWSHDAVLPQSSVATNVRTIEPEHAPPDNGLSLQVTVTPPQLSDAVASALLHTGTSEAHSTVIDAGHVIDGGMLSITTMICSQEAVLPQSSVATKVLTTDPEQLSPTNGPSEHVTVTPPQLSDAVASAGSQAGISVTQDTVSDAGQAIDGGVLSSTVMTWSHEAELLFSSVAT